MTIVAEGAEKEGVDDPEFRARVRSFMEAHATRRPAHEDPLPRARGVVSDGELVATGRAYQAALFDAGLAGLTWPAEYGGQGLPSAYQSIFNDEVSDYYTPDSIYTIGFGMCIPTLLAHASDANKRRHVAPAARGEEIWCQLFSEPSAGSDVASLRSRAIRDGDEWILNGQKIWTSGAQYCQFGIVLARTDIDAPKHRGLSMFILDMQSPGVTIKPLRQMNGASGFNEVFFDDVRIPGDRLLGSAGDGWHVALTTLMNERVAIGSGRSSEKAPPLAPIAVHLDLAQRRGIVGDALVRQDLVDLYIRYRVLEMLGLRIRGTLAAGRVPGPEGSVAKLSGAVLARHSADVAARLAGPSATAWPAGDASSASQMVLTAPAGGIAGGTNEVMRNILGERVLGLPKEPSVDRDTPFKDLPFS
jgi:alkylation response protein AidB-like acyl-CoA dehydrogenase